MANRLNLNFGLETNKERSEFLANYLERPEFQKRPPSEEELETMSNYILWGKDPKKRKKLKLNKKRKILVCYSHNRVSFIKKERI